MKIPALARFVQRESDSRFQSTAIQTTACPSRSLCGQTRPHSGRLGLSPSFPFVSRRELHSPFAHLQHRLARVYSTTIMARVLRRSRGDRTRRVLGLAVLIVFAVGSIGWPQQVSKPGGGQCLNLAGKSICCCSDRPRQPSCGCCKTAGAVKGGCCQSKRLARRSAAPTVKCACGDSAPSGFVVAAQPRMSLPTLIAPQLCVASRFVHSAFPQVDEASFSPETPPPRPSVG